MKKKYLFIILIVLFSLFRLLFSCNLPSFYISNLRFDDYLMIKYMNSIYKGNYLGDYNMYTLIKGIVFPLILVVARGTKISYSLLLTFIYMISILFFINSCKLIIKNKKQLFIIYFVLLYNPLTFSSELFQRMYLSSLSIPELFFFLGFYINSIYNNNNKTIFNYMFLGITSGIMLLTRNDTIWVYILLTILFIFKIYKNRCFRNIILNLFPFLFLCLVLCVMSFINFKYYRVFTYNELEYSSFKKAYNSILKINNGSSKKVSISKETLYVLSDKSYVFDLDKNFIEEYYNHVDINTLDDGNMIWFFRNLVYDYKKFKDGKEAKEYFSYLNNDINRMFKEGELKKKNSLPVIYTSFIELKDLKRIPSSLIRAIIYTTTYQNVKTYTNIKLENDVRFICAKETSYFFTRCSNYRYSENMIDNNSYPYEIIRLVYKYLTIVFSIISLIIYIRNIKSKDNLNYILHIIVLLYFIILGGVVYVDVTSFHAIRYRYLSNVYILQEIFILFNMVRLLDKRYNFRLKQIIKK